MSSGKVKCTCGWSWNKSDSSKKDMYICHECGRDNSNNMKNGGWLDSYADGGTMQEHQENYNDPQVSLPEGFVGMGNNTKGRDYSPAWGGQFQMGGQAPKRRGVRYNEDGSVSTHLMKTETDGKGNWFSFPTLFQNSIPYADDSENWLDMSDRPWEEAYEEAKKRGEVINFGSDKDAAIKFGQGSWKDKKQMGGSVYPVNYVPEAQMGRSIGPSPIMPLTNLLVNKFNDWFGDDDEQPVKKPVAKGKARTLNIVDPRKKMATTNQPLRPNSDLVGGKYNSNHLDKLMQEAKRQKLSKQDMMNLSAMGFQETKWGRSDGNIGHVLHTMDNPGSSDDYVDFVDAYKSKMKLADRLKIKDPAMRLQVYNGLGTITPKTEKNYHGFEMQKIYGVPIPKGGINMKKNPLYGKQVMDIRDNVLAKNPEYLRYMDSIYKAPVPGYMQDVRMNKQKPPRFIIPPLGKKEMGGSIPGAVGFSYARTNDPAPDNGPGAKKTMASAQNGKWLGNKLNKQGYITSETKGGNRISFTGNQRADEWINKQIDSGKFGFDPTTGGTFPLKKPVKGLSKKDQFIGTKQYYDLQAPQGFNTEDQFTQIEKLPEWQQEVINDSNESRRKNYIEGNMEEVVKHPLWSPGYFTPEGALIGAMQGATKMGPDLYEGNYKAAAMDALMMLPLAPSVVKTATPLIQKAGKALGTEEGLLSNTWKLNPRAYQYNLPENTMWRGLGKQGMEDAVSSGLFRSKQNVAAEFFPGSTLRMDKSFGTNPYFTPKFETASTYGDNFLAEVPRDAANWRNRYARTDWSQVADKPIPIDEGRLLQKDWWQGYKPIETSTPSIVDINNSGSIQRQGFPNLLGTVDSVIPRPPTPGMLLGMEDSWNNYSPFNLIPGYGEKLSARSSHPNFVGFRKFGNSIDDVIESQSLRPKGTGMGSKQIMSEGNWAEPGKVNENYSGVFEATMNPQIQGSNIKLEKWNKRNGIVGTTQEGDVAIPLTDTGLSFNRRLPFSNRYIPIDKDKLINNQFQLSTQLPHLQSLVEKYGLWAGGAGAAGYFTGGSEGAKENINTLNKYTIDPLIDFTKPYYNKAEEEFIRQTGNKKDGGVIKDDMGYWNPDNWGSPVEIGSTDITMEGVYEPLLGISDTGDTKVMKPGKNYKFKGKKVTEYPMAKNGLRQEQKGLVNLDQLTNFTNYNTKQPGGWLDKY